jgi:hypothetical protein
MKRFALAVLLVAPALFVVGRTVLAAGGTVEAFVDCVQVTAGGSATAYFSYENHDPSVIVLSSDSNYFTPQPENRGQPYYFQPGLHTRVFSVTWNPSTEPQIQWTLIYNAFASVATADVNAPPCSTSQRVIGTPVTKATVAAGDAVTATANCPAGSAAIGGGARVDAQKGSLALTNSYPVSDSSWEVDYTGIARATGVVVTPYVVCTA